MHGGREGIWGRAKEARRWYRESGVGAKGESGVGAWNRCDLLELDDQLTKLEHSQQPKEAEEAQRAQQLAALTRAIRRAPRRQERMHLDQRQRRRRVHPEPAAEAAARHGRTRCDQSASRARSGGFWATCACLHAGASDAGTDTALRFEGAAAARCTIGARSLGGARPIGPGRGRRC